MFQYYRTLVAAPYPLKCIREHMLFSLTGMPFPIDTHGDLLILKSKARSYFVNCSPSLSLTQLPQPFLQAIIVFWLCIFIALISCDFNFLFTCMSPIFVSPIFVLWVLSTRPSQWTCLVMFLNEQVNEWSILDRWHLSCLCSNYPQGGVILWWVSRSSLWTSCYLPPAAEVLWMISNAEFKIGCQEMPLHFLSRITWFSP